jgi:hypothetical protein
VISSNTELYVAVERLSKALQDAGQQQWGESLNEAMSISSVPGEILGEIRLQLRNLRETQIPDRLGLTPQLSEALAYLERILGPIYH